MEVSSAVRANTYLAQKHPTMYSWGLETFLCIDYKGWENGLTAHPPLLLPPSHPFHPFTTTHFLSHQLQF